MPEFQLLQFLVGSLRARLARAEPREAGALTLELVAIAMILVAIAGEGASVARARAGTVTAAEQRAHRYLGVLGTGLLTGPSIQINDTAATVTVQVSGQAQRIVPGFPVHVTQTVHSPTERFAPSPAGSSHEPPTIPISSAGRARLVGAEACRADAGAGAHPMDRGGAHPAGDGRPHAGGQRGPRRRPGRLHHAIGAGRPARRRVGRRQLAPAGPADLPSHPRHHRHRAVPARWDGPGDGHLHDPPAGPRPVLAARGPDYQRHVRRPHRREPRNPAMNARRLAVADQTGSISASVPLLVLTVLVLVGFVFDGGNAITAHRRAVNLAEQAARAGAQRLDTGALRSR